MNTWNGIGRLCNEPEIRYTAQKNEACANFRIAVDRKFKTEGRPDADFFKCSAFGKTAEFVEKYIRKGMKVGVTARVQNDEFTNREGKRVVTTYFLVESIEFCEKKQEAPAPDPAGFMNAGDEELPFNI